MPWAEPTTKDYPAPTGEKCSCREKGGEKREKKRTGFIFLLESQFNCGVLWACVRSSPWPFGVGEQGPEGGEGAKDNAGILPVSCLPELGIS